MKHYPPGLLDGRWEPKAHLESLLRGLERLDQVDQIALDQKRREFEAEIKRTKAFIAGEPGDDGK